MFLRANQNVVVKYPYAWVDLRKEFPNISFSINIQDSDINPLGVYRVQSTNKPSANYDQNVVELDPVLEDGVWKQQWSVEPATSEEVDARIAKRWMIVRQERDAKLTASDWTQLPDVTLSNVDAWKEYRQALRDVTNAPNPFVVEFPEPPTA